MIAIGLAALAFATAASPSAAGRPADKTQVLRVDGWRFRVDAPPPDWADPAFDDRGWMGPAPAPFAPPPPPLPPAAASPAAPVATPPGAGQSSAPPPPATLFSPAPGRPLLLRGHFAVAAPARLRVLELRVAYLDGFVAYLNGREIARVGMTAAAVRSAAATAPHGPEVERVTIPLPGVSGAALNAGDNLLAIAVYAYPGRSAIVPTAPAAAVELAAATGVRIVRGPYLIAPFEDRNGAGLSVAWETDLPARGAVTVAGADDKPDARPRRVATGAPATRQVVKLDRLAPGAAYRYSVEVDAGAGDTAAAPAARFQTVAAAPAPVRFAIYGDMRFPGHADHRAVVEGLVREAPSLVINTGDLTDEGSQESNWQRYFEIAAPLGAIAPVVPALGNHDAGRHGAGQAIAWRLFGVPAHPPPGWTSFDLGGVHFVLLDTNQFRKPEQRAWLVADLARARRHHPRAVFVFGHEALWSHGLHGGDHLLARLFGPVLAAGHVDVLFSGHDHIYERGTANTSAGKLTYVVTGGGGAPLYDPTCAAAGGPPPGDVSRPLPPCPASVAALTKQHHYIMVEVSDGAITLCPRRPDGSPVEACVHLTPQR